MQVYRDGKEGDWDPESVCGCCGSRYNREFSTFNYNPGVSIGFSTTLVARENDEYWTESVPMPDGTFLVVQHLTQDGADAGYNKDEESEDD